MSSTRDLLLRNVPNVVCFILASVWRNLCEIIYFLIYPPRNPIQNRSRSEGMAIFLKLPPEIQVEVVERFFDLPTRLSFSLVSTEFRNHWPIENFQNWTFVDDCAAHGYIDLLKFAFE